MNTSVILMIIILILILYIYFTSSSSGGLLGALTGINIPGVSSVPGLNILI